MQFVIGLLVLGLLIAVHEWGHLLAAKWLGVPVPVFSVGFGPKLCAVTWHDTEYRLCAVPLGGYVLLDKLEPPSDVPPWRRIIIFFAGPLANVVLALLLFVAAGHPEMFADSLLAMGDLLKKLFTGQVSLDQLSGPVGIIRIAGDSVSMGIERLAKFAGFLSLNLAVLNLLPLPVLDGGQILISAYEGVTRRAVHTRVRIAMAAVAWIFLLGIFAYVTLGDVRHLLAS